MTPKPCLNLRLSSDVSFVESTVVIVAAVTVWIYLGCIYTWNIALILSLSLILSLFLELINRVNFQIILIPKVKRTKLLEWKFKTLQKSTYFSQVFHLQNIIFRLSLKYSLTFMENIHIIFSILLFERFSLSEVDKIIKKNICSYQYFLMNKKTESKSEIFRCVHFHFNRK